MKSKKKWNLNINTKSKRPKYLQIVDAMMEAIESGSLSGEDQLPTVNTLLKAHDVSRDTVVKAYDRLKRRGIIESVPGKGYYVKTTTGKNSKKVLLMFNKLSLHKKIIYDAFINRLGKDIAVDFYIYNNDYRLFKSLLEPRLQDNYSAYVIIGHFLSGGLSAIDTINEIPKEKLVVVDKDVKGVRGRYAAVFQDFETDIYQVLEDANSQISKYERAKLIFPSYTYQPKEIVSGFIKYCTKYQLAYDIVKDLASYKIEKGTAYVVTMEDDLVTLIKKMKVAKLHAGSDIGIISYNETPLKEILLDGITTISTDFECLGETAADLVLNGEKAKIKNPFNITFRNSL